MAAVMSAQGRPGIIQNYRFLPWEACREAGAAGYADQAHLINEFHALYDVSPQHFQAC